MICEKLVKCKNITQTHTSIGPGDRSEEARPSVTIDRCQTEGDMRERAVKVPLDLHRNPRPHGINSQMLPPWEGSWTLTQGTHDTPRNEQEHIPHTGEFHPSLNSPFIPFTSVICQQGLLYRWRYRYKNPLAKENSHLFHYITAALGLPLHKHIEIIFCSVKIQSPLVIDTLV